MVVINSENSQLSMLKQRLDSDSHRHKLIVVNVQSKAVVMEMVVGF